MKRLVWQCYVPATVDKFRIIKDPNWWKVSVDHVKRYAKRIGADYKFFGNPYMNLERKFVSGITYEKCRVITDPFFDDYDEHVHFDVDMIPNPNAPSIFDDVDVEYAAFAEYDWFRDGQYGFSPDTPKEDMELIITSTEAHFETYGMKCPRRPDGSLLYYNSGTMYWTREGVEYARENFIPLDKYKPNPKVKRMNSDEHWWNINIYQSGIPLTTLPRAWNQIVNTWGHAEDDNPHIFHYSTSHNKLLMVKEWANKKT